MPPRIGAGRRRDQAGVAAGGWPAGALLARSPCVRPRDVKVLVRCLEPLHDVVVSLDVVVSVMARAHNAQRVTDERRLAHGRGHRAKASPPTTA